MPKVEFPAFPLANHISDNGDGTCTVDSDWIVKLAEYSILIQETENNYKEIKKLYENN